MPSSDSRDARTPATGAEARLEDRYLVEDGRVLLSGIQALVRVTLDIHRADRRRGRRTGILVSGYEGSPLGGYDLALSRERRLLEAHDVHLVPGVNEELAATAVWGSQQDSLGPLAGRDGVVGIWYGKAPGVDRAGDAFRHANFMGPSPRGGVLVLAGDDPTAKSSTLPSASEAALAELGMPVLAPGNVQEILDLALHGVALSRCAGLWVAMKLVTNVADGYGTARVSPTRVSPVEPTVVVDGAAWRYHQGVLTLGPESLVDEHEMFTGRIAAARAYARANGLNEITHSGGPRARLGIVAAGKPYHDLVGAFELLGLDGAALEEARVRVLHLGMLWPLEPEVLRAFAAGLDEILVIEEKRGFVETQVRDLLYDLDERPRIVGKRDEAGRNLVRSGGELSADLVARVVHQRLERLGIAVRGPVVTVRAGGGQGVTGHPDPAIIPPGPVGARTPDPIPDGAARAAYFCSGCPHNRSTVVPDGSFVAGGIGCHTLAVRMDRGILCLTQMGGEGAEWIGRAPFTERDHLFQNIGDGTFFHSGSLAVRACIAAGVHITFKLLYNGAVAMTGGQSPQGGLDVPELTRLLEVEGVSRTIVCAEDPLRYGGARFAPNAVVWPRERLDDAQRALRDVPGVTVLVYDQDCAIEKRRDRRQGRSARPATRAVINELVCEGCGDCGSVSNCLSVQPVDTELGRKTRIHQSSCNQDFTCLEGDCPSFVTVTRRRRVGRGIQRRAAPAAAPRAGTGTPIDADALEAASLAPLHRSYGVLMTGIGGTGVVTASQVLATAAHLEGLEVSGLDQTGLSQKGGPVLSHLRISSQRIDSANVVGEGGADLLLAFDVLVAAEAGHLEALRPGTRTVVSTSRVATGPMVTHTDIEFPPLDGLVGAIERRAGALTAALDADALAEALFGDHLLANTVTLGLAAQLGLLPVSTQALEEALRLNGVAVEANLQAFRWGRRYAVEPAAVIAAAGLSATDARPGGVPASAPGAVPVTLRTRAETTRAGLPHRAWSRADTLLRQTAFAPPLPDALRRALERRVAELVDYQGPGLARPYLDVVTRVHAAEQGVVPGRVALTDAVVRNLYKLTAVKDEYEVARLSLRPELRDAVREQVPEGGRVAYLLQPPFLRAIGLHRKMRVGAWFRPAFRALRAARRVRGTALDPFGHTRMRRLERRLLRDYRAMIESELEHLDADSVDRATRLADLPDLVRGFEDVKLASVRRYEAALRAVLDERVAASPSTVGG